MKRDETNTMTEIQITVRTRDRVSGKIVGDSSTFNTDSHGYLAPAARETLAHNIFKEARGRLLDATKGPPGPARN